MKIEFGEFLRYLAISFMALVADASLFSFSLRLLDFPWMLAATLGFVVGAFTAYLLSIRFVFRSRVLEHAPKSEFMAFAAIGLVGLGITQLVLWIGIEQFRVNPELSKLAAAGITFVFNYILRKIMLFRQHLQGASNS